MDEATRWQVMWGMAVGFYGAFKLFTWLRRRSGSPLVLRNLAYLFGWPGMNPEQFLTRPAAKRPTMEEWLFALAKTALGFGLLYVAAPAALKFGDLASGWVGMIGIGLILHFGLFHLLSCAFRQIGWNAVPIMNWPILAKSVTEYWGRRWNLAFHDLAHPHLFQPLTRKFGPIAALWVTFGVSGIVHDVVMSIPAGGGYGAPTCFFLVQAAAMMIERSKLGRRLGLGQGARGWLFAVLAIVGASPLLLHPPFVREVVLPFMVALGALQ